MSSFHNHEYAVNCLRLSRTAFLRPCTLPVSSSATFVISMSLVMRSKKDVRSCGGQSCCPQSCNRFIICSIICDALLMARCTSSSDGEVRTSGTASCTSTMKKGSSSDRNEPPVRVLTRFLSAFIELLVASSSWWYMKEL